ncbi:MAG: hypothetical protein ABR915_18240 [Thermoguttaceae bacterium]|jgi:hypothetical protein
MSAVHTLLGNSGVHRTLNDPPTGIVAITPSDATPLAEPIRGFMVAAAGNVAIVMLDDSRGTYPGCSPGAMYPGAIKQVMSTGTTATGIVGFY